MRTLHTTQCAQWPPPTTVYIAYYRTFFYTAYKYAVCIHTLHTAIYIAHYHCTLLQCTLLSSLPYFTVDHELIL